MLSKDDEEALDRALAELEDEKSDQPTGYRGDQINFDAVTGEPYLNVPGHSAFGPLSASTQSLSSSISLSIIPHRKWLYGIDCLRGEITVLASPGGVGKSSFALGIAVSVATGRELLGSKIYGNKLSALYINAEDGQVEMLRRVWGIALHYGISQQDLARLCVLGANDWQVQRISFLRAEKFTSSLDQEGINYLDTLLDELRPDVVVLDPLVSLCAGGNMNDNAVMALVMRAIKRLAAKHHCAVLAIHHTRKGGDLSNAEAVGGASAIVNLARRVLMAASMSPDEAKGLGVLPSQRWRYLRVTPGKSNLAPPAADIDWYELRSVTLPNAEPPIYPTGDCVQVITVASLPAAGAPLGVDLLGIQRAILDVIDAGKLINGNREPYSPSTAGAANARGLKPDALAAARQVVGPDIKQNDLSAVVDRAIKELKDSGALGVMGPIGGNGPFRKGKGLSVDWSNTPWAAEKAPTPSAPQLPATAVPPPSTMPEDAQ